jgi:hypothetical protein
MAIRIRNVDGLVVALCAVETDAKDGDIYLDDNMHHALSTKFALDWESEGLLVNPPVDKDLQLIMEDQQVRCAEDELWNWLKGNQ